MMPHTAPRKVPLQTDAFLHPRRAVSHLGVRAGMTVADFGAGSGAYVLAIAEILQNSGALYAIDVQQDLLRRVHNEATHRGFKNVKIIWADLEKHKGSKIAQGTVDLVLIS